MTTLRFRGQEIGSFTPAFDSRNADNLFVIGGHNYSFDSKGPKTDFGDRFMTASRVRDGNDVHGTRIEGRAFVHTPDSLLEYDASITAWIPQYYFTFPEDEENPGFTGLRWSAAFLNRTIFLAHKNYGWLKVSTLSEDVDQIFIAIDDSIHPGLPAEPLSVVESNGRLIVLTDTTVSWSGPSDGTDWVVALGGAGFQVVADRVGGDPIALTSFSGGFIVWTSSSALLAEFVGGDIVFRFTVLASKNRPQNSFTIVQLNQDEALFLTTQGLFSTKNGRVPEVYQAGFNEFLRDYLSLNPKAEGRLEYDAFRDRLYVQVRTHPFFYDRAFVLVPTINKWGEFNERNTGIFPVTPTNFGWLSADRLIRRWEEVPSREILPTDVLIELEYPRVAKRSVGITNVWSTSGVCQNVSHTNQIREGYYNADVDVPAAVSTMGLMASIEIGYFHPAQLENAADGLVEIQNIVLGSYPQALPADLIPGNLEYDTFVEHYELMYRESSDWSDSGEDDEDWNLAGDDEDWSTPYAFLNEYAYEIVLRSSQDGFTYVSVPVERARFDTKATTYSCMSSGTLHTLLLSANNPGNAIQVRYLEMTMNYGGRLV